MDTPARPIRLLVIANETAEGEALFEAIRERAAGRGAAVLVVAPARVDDREAAQARLDACLDRLDQAGLYVRGWVGDPNPLRATDDALRRFSADELIVATHPARRSAWLGRDLVGRARRRYAVPITHVVVDPAAAYAAA